MKLNSILGFLSWNVLLTCAALAQSSFSFRTYDPGSGIDVPIFDAHGTLLTGTDYLAELWGGATADSLVPLVDIIRDNRREIRPFNERGYIISGSAFLSVLAVPPGSSAWLQMRAWDARLGGSYEGVAALGLGGYGESPIFYTQGGNPGVPTPPGPLLGLQSFSLLPVIPEPSTALLLLLGLPLLLVLRRRRRP